MINSSTLAREIYAVGDRKLSMRDLLLRFSDDRYQLDGVWRMSDLHLKVGAPVCYRYDDELRPLDEAADLDRETLQQLILPMLSPAQIETLQGDAPPEVDAGFELKDEGLSFRLNVFHDRDGIACAIRVLPKTIPPLDQIGFPSDDAWRGLVEMRQGLVIVTGVTGSGKSTTVASLLQHINRNRPARIITLEDPVEYVLERDRALISQRELGTHIRSFDGGLRAALREDPDVIFIGEMRDRETSALALSAAETGHLVLSTLHTKDAKGAITRIVDMFPEERVKEVATQLSFSLSCVLAQKLVPRRGGQGRLVAMEVLRNIPAMANLIRTGRWEQIYNTIEGNRKAGLITLERHLTELVRRGEIARDVAQRYANDPSLVFS